MIQDRDLNSNVDTDSILSLLALRNAQDCIDTPQKFHTRDYYVLKYQSHDPDTPTYMESLSVEKWNNTSRQWMTELKVL